MSQPSRRAATRAITGRVGWDPVPFIRLSPKKSARTWPLPLGAFALEVAAGRANALTTRATAAARRAAVRVRMAGADMSDEPPSLSTLETDRLLRRRMKEREGQTLLPGDAHPGPIGQTGGGGAG